MTLRIDEWYRLRCRLSGRESSREVFDNQFYRRLLCVLDDRKARDGDILSAYRDALCAKPTGVDAPCLPSVRLDGCLEQSFKRHGLRRRGGSREVELRQDEPLLLNVSDGVMDLSEVYALKQRRVIHGSPIDPSLTKRLRQTQYERYRGAGQRDAVRAVLTSQAGSTFLLNLPTGVGKTLVIESIVAFSSSHVLTVVIVPTIALALDQARRMQSTLSKMGEDHGGAYCWYGGLSDIDRAETMERVRAGRQRVLFCSPESGLATLAGPILGAAGVGALGTIAIDEAHLVDQWGAEFRPDFQGVSALLNSARRLTEERLASDRHDEYRRSGVRCLLLSATFSKKTMAILRSLFASQKYPFVSVHGGFLRPEIEYGLRRVSFAEHRASTLEAVSILPKPLMVYTTTVNEANAIFDQIRADLEMARVALFTGQTEDGVRSQILNDWANEALDIVVATSAFGVGINKPNVRSVLHASVPDNLDRFYQEVGRAGRDGAAAVSVVVFEASQLETARSLNEQKLITAERGRERWSMLWDHGHEEADGRKRINLGVIPNDLIWSGAENQKWNWRTITLMQRAGAIDVEVARPMRGRDSISDSITPHQGQNVERYSRRPFEVELIVDPLIDQHRSEDFWSDVVERQRRYEKEQQAAAHNVLRKWLLNPHEIKLCHALRDHYAIEGIQPEVVCAGCPCCRLSGMTMESLPVVGAISHVRGLHAPTHWGRSRLGSRTQVRVYYEVNAHTEPSRFIEASIHWISRLLEREVVAAIRAPSDSLQCISDRLPRGYRRFWAALPLDKEEIIDTPFRELVLIPPGYAKMPSLGLSITPRIVIAPRNIRSSRHPGRLWWQDDATSMDLRTFLNVVS